MGTGIFVACAGRQDGGPETYERHLVQSIAAVDKKNPYDIYCFSQAAVDSFNINQENIQFHKLWPSSRWFSLPVSLPLSMAVNKTDLYHATFIPAPASTASCVFTMHDVSPFTHPEFYPKPVISRLAPMIKRGLNNAKLIICISENCRRTTAEYFNIPLEKMVVVHHGVNPNLKPTNKEKARQILSDHYDIEGPYILYLGKLEARKNIARIIEAYAQLREETNCDAKLVLGGRRFWDLHGIDETIEKLNLKDYVVELGYVPDSHLSPLYSTAEMFVFPTLWEGFGFPVLEAMACGTPVITSNVSCLPEIAGGAAKLVDPSSTKQIAEAMFAVLTDNEKKAEMIRLGADRVKDFSWERCAQLSINAYQQARML